MNNLKKKIRSRPIWGLALWLTTLIAAAVILSPSGVSYYLINPNTSSIMQYRRAQFVQANVPLELHQQWRGLAEISPNLQRAVIAAEDARFYEHFGFDFVELKRAISDYRVGKRRVRGASTISQQLAKNLFLSPKRTLLRKATEAWLTARLELMLSKHKILELYLNTIEWGKGVFGAEAAARYYFGRSAKQLSVSQAAFLAAILPSPTNLYDPHKNYARVSARQRKIIGLMSH